jgi:hypothetical protein
MRSNFCTAAFLSLLALAPLAGCTAYVKTDSPPPAKVEVESRPAPAKVDVNVDRGPGPGANVNVDVKKP